MAMQKIHLMGLLLLLTIVGSPATAKELVCVTDTDLSRAHFPEGFLFGTATSAYQVEGAVYETGRGRSMWDVYCKKHPGKCSNESGDVAADFFHRYKEDIQLMKNLNTDAFRMSISWSRIFPYGKRENGVSQAGVKFYHDVIDELNRNGIIPFVTIFHWDTPQDLEDEYGGFLNETIVKDFRNYAEFLFHEYGGKVKHWITINEPWVYAHAGYDVGKKAPGRCSEHAKENGVIGKCLGGKSGNEIYNVTHNLLLAHAEAVDAFRDCKKWHQCEGGKIGIAHSPAWFKPYNSEDKDDQNASGGRVLDYLLGWFLEPTLSGDYPKTMRDELQGRLPSFTPEQKKKLEKSTDFLGINYYSSLFAKNLKPDEKTDKHKDHAGSRWELTNEGGYGIGTKPKTADLAVYSRGFRTLLKYVKDKYVNEKYGNQEIMIMENGYGEIPPENAKDVSIEVGTADYNRREYLDRHLTSLYEAICYDKVNVTGYFAWSLLDNFEWQSGYKVRFGLYYVDFKNNQQRYEKLSAKFYREFLSEGVRPSQIPNKKDEL